MPNQAAKRLCRKFGCQNLVASGYCPQHKQAECDPEHNKIYNRTWARVRLSYLRDHPLCCDCEKEGIIHVADEVHHIRKARTHPELRLEPTNLMAICKHHHSVRTARGE